jgi:hypothetical protein
MIKSDWLAAIVGIGVGIGVSAIWVWFGRRGDDRNPMERALLPQIEVS